MLLFALDDWASGKPIRIWPWADLTIVGLILLHILFDHLGLIR